MRPLTGTYRIQFEPHFTFAEARELVPYWVALGVSHLYCSPIFAARAGSRHGYDVVDHGAINPALGGEAGFRLFAAHARAAGLGLILDIVPNHAGIGAENERWQTALEFGARSPDARFFDVDWTRGRLTLPFAEGPLDTLLRDGQLALAAEPETGRLVVAYHEHRFPLRPRTAAELLRAATGRGEDAALDAWAALDDTAIDRAEIARRREAVRPILASVEPDRLAEAFADHDRIRAILHAQHWRLKPWRSAASVLTYRRFFDVTGLIGVRVEEPEVFEAVHRLPVALVREGLVDGLRVDHVDGLADPEAYCRQLREAVGPTASLHLEKILAHGEGLREWPVDGTTGYETLVLIGGLFVDPEGYAAFAGEAARNGAPGGPLERRRDAKLEILATSLGAELRALAALAAAVLRRRGLPFDRRTLRRAIAAFIAVLPVYRTYIGERVDPADRDLVEAATAEADATLGRLGSRALTALSDALLAAPKDAAARRLARRLQQLSGPAMAKGYEDTELYRFVGLLAVNEVGGHLEAPATDFDHFHATMAEQAARFPAAMVPLATHDTKRGSDARARLALLSGMAPDWLARCRDWRDRHAALRDVIDGAEVPDPLDEMLVYQTLWAAWPIGMDRLGPYLEKALREAKRHTEWVRQNPAYEAAVLDFARRLVESPEGARFRAELGVMDERLAEPARRIGLSQTLLQLTIPGVPDIYRGSEFWDTVLVDPDNRRPVDWTARRDGLEVRALPDLADDTAGLWKQRLIARLLAARAASPSLFSGPYRPLAAVGAPDVIAFARTDHDTALVVAVPTRPLQASDAPVAIALPFQRWSERAVLWGAPPRLVDNSLQFGPADLPAAVLLDVLPD